MSKDVNIVKTECTVVKYEKTFQKFLNESLNRSKMVSLIYGNNGNIGTTGLGYIEPLKSVKTDFVNTSACPKLNKHSVCSYCKNRNQNHMCYVCNKKKGKHPFKTNKKGPKKIWVPKDQIIYVADMLHSRIEKQVMVPGQWVFTTHDRRKAYVPRAAVQR